MDAAISSNQKNMRTVLQKINELVMDITVYYQISLRNHIRGKVMNRAGKQLAALAVIICLLVPPHACCFKLVHVPVSGCCACCNQGDAPAQVPLPSRPAPCCQDHDPALLVVREAQIHDRFQPDPAPPQFSEHWNTCLSVSGCLAVANPPPPSPGRRVHLLLCRFNC